MGSVVEEIGRRGCLGDEAAVHLHLLAGRRVDGPLASIEALRRCLQVAYGERGLLGVGSAVVEVRIPQHDTVMADGIFIQVVVGPVFVFGEQPARAFVAHLHLVVVDQKLQLAHARFLRQCCPGAQGQRLLCQGG